MRTLLTLMLLTASLLAQEARTTIAERFPSGATAYVEISGLAKTVDAFLESELGATLRTHDAVERFLSSPQGIQLMFGDAFLVGATGEDILGNLRTLASRRVGFAVYGKPQRFVAVAQVDGEKIEGLLRGVELLAKFEREVVVPAEGQRPALWKFKDVFVIQQGEWLTVSPDQLLITSIHSGAASGLASDARFRESRRSVPTDALAFAYLDLEPFRAKLRSGELPEDLGAAFFSGAAPHRLREAPWAAFGIEAEQSEGAWTFNATAAIPGANEEDEAVSKSYGGSLRELPFTLSDRTVGMLRMRRDLGSIWSNRDALIAERGIPKMIEFETNFGNLTAGMSWVEEFLPNLGEEFILLGLRPEWPEEGSSPVLQLPAGAILWPLKDAEKMERSLRVTFYNTIGIVNASQQGMMEGVSLLPMADIYKGVRIETARYAPPEEKSGRSLHVRYNLAPSLAVVDGYVVLASSDAVIRALIDGRGGATPASRKANVEFRINPGEAQFMLRENREQLIAQTMLRQGDDRKAAEGKIDLALDLARMLTRLDFAVEESADTYGARLRLALQSPAAGK